MPQSTWIILGGSSSIARAFSNVVAANHQHIILAGRDLEDLEITANNLRLKFGASVKTIHFDAFQKNKHQQFIEECCNVAIGDINIFLAYGIMPEQCDLNDNIHLIENIVEINYLSVLTLLTKFSPILQNQGKGKIIVLSSVAGDRGRKKNYIYGSTKAGLDVFLEGLRARLFPSGVYITTVKPGFVDTAMTFGKQGLFLVAKPLDLAKACWKQSNKNREVFYYPWFFFWIMLIIKLIPGKIFKRLNI